MIIDALGEKYTPNQLAKELLLSAMGSASYWEESGEVEVQKLTERERKEINKALEKQWRRVKKFFTGDEQPDWYLG